MRKIRISTLLVIVIFVMSYVLSAPVFAAGQAKSTEKTISISGKAVTIDSKLSKEEIALLTPELVNDLDLNDGSILSVTQTITNMSEETAFSENLITPMSVIPTSQLYLTVVAQRYQTSSAYDYIKYSAIATWNYLPLLKLTDSFGIAWSDDFTLLNDYCISYYTYVQGPTKSIYNTRQSMTPEVGVGYEVPMTYDENWITYYITKSKLYAYTRKLNSAGTANVVAEYAHEYLALFGGTIDMSFSRTPSISFSADFGISYNTASPAYDSFDY